MSQPKRVYERPVPPSVRWTSLGALMLLAILLAGGGLFIKGQGGVMPFGESLSHALGEAVPGSILATSILGLYVAIQFLCFLLFPAWLRRRYGACTIENGVLEFRLPSLFPERGEHGAPTVVSAELGDGVWRAVPEGLLVELPGRPVFKRLTQPLLVPVPNAERDDLLTWLNRAQTDSLAGL